MERFDLALRTSGSSQMTRRLTPSLPSEEFAELTLLVSQMARRYPAQDLTDAMEGIITDLEALAVLYSLAAVFDALVELRRRPGQEFFPMPDKVHQEIIHQRDAN